MGACPLTCVFPTVNDTQLTSQVCAGFSRNSVDSIGMKPFFDFQHRVADDEIDAQQHVHNLRYLQWTLWAARDHAASWGWDAAGNLQRNIGWVVRSHEITYRAAALAGDELIIRTWISELGRVASRRRFAICRPADKMVLARGETRWALVDLSVRQAITIPDSVSATIKVLEKAPALPWEDHP